MGFFNDFLENVLGMEGDPPAPSTNDSFEAVLQTLIKNLPALGEAMRQQIGPAEMAKLESSEAISPRAAQLALNITKEFAPQIAEVENRITANRKLSDASGDLAVVQGPGGDLAKAATDLGANVIDPEFFKVRKAAGDKTAQLIAGFDPDKLSGGERAEVERSLNVDASRSGNLGNNEGINAVNNAMHFGSALQAKRASIGNALAQATTAAPALRSGIDYFGRAQTQTPYTNQFQPVKETGNTGSEFATNAFNQVTGLRQQENEINANRRDATDRAAQLLGAI